MLNLKNFLFKGGLAADLPDDLRVAIEAWRNTPAPADDAHFHTRYVVLDIVSSGTNPETDKLYGISATTVRQSSILPNDAFFLDCSMQESADAVDRELMAFLQFTAKAPIVTYHVPYVEGFLRRAFKEHLGIDFQAQWIDLAWLLPAMFEEKSARIMPLNDWIEVFGLDAGSGRRTTMENALMLARIFQMLLVRANNKNIDTSASLIKESRASSFLRRTH